MPPPGSPDSAPRAVPGAGFWILLPLACGAALAIAWCTALPLGIPGEWTWPRIESGEPLAWRLVIPLFVAALYLGFAWFAGQRIEHATPGRLRATLAGLALLGFAWLGTLQQACPEGYDLGKSAWVLYYPKSSGYFTEARAHHHELGQYLAHYEDLVAQGDVLHQGTHPPGLILAFSTLLTVVERVPGLVPLLRETEPASVSRSFDELQALTRQSGPGGGAGAPLSPEDRAVLWLALLLVQGAAALTVIPLYALARTTQGRSAAFFAAALWPLVPALATFIPKSDALFPLWTCTLTWTALRAASAQPRRAWGWGLLAGLLFSLGMLLSLATLAIGFCAVVAACAHRRQQQRPLWAPPTLEALGAAALAFCVVTLLFSVALSCPLLTIWKWNYHNHAGFYAQFSRTWWKWLAENPIELAIAVGLPAAGCALLNARECVSQRRWSLPLVTFGVTWGLLWLTGKNRGEAARLWLFLMPLVCWLAADLLDRLPRQQRLRTGIALLTLQLVTAAGLVLRIGGFEY